MNKHRAKCDVLKKIRKGIADKLGIDLHQRECTFEGECKGTCPKCKQEEDILNREIAKRAGVLALGATASFMLTACAPVGNGNGTPEDPDGAITPEIMDVAGGLMPAEDESSAVVDELMGEPISPDVFVTTGVPAIQGDIAYEDGEDPAPEDEETTPECEEADNSEEEDFPALTGVPLYDGED